MQYYSMYYSSCTMTVEGRWELVRLTGAWCGVEVFLMRLAVIFGTVRAELKKALSGIHTCFCTW